MAMFLHCPKLPQVMYSNIFNRKTISNDIFC